MRVVMPAVQEQVKRRSVWYPKYHREFTRQRGEHYHFAVDNDGNFSDAVVEVVVTDEEGQKLLATYPDVIKGATAS